MFVFTSRLVCHEVCIEIQYFFGLVIKNTSNTKYLEIIKRGAKVQEKDVLCERALNFDQ